MVALELEVLGGEGVDADEEVADDGGVGVETAVKEGLYAWDLVPFGALEVFLDVFPFGFADFAGGQGEVSEILAVLEEGEIELRG